MKNTFHRGVEDMVAGLAHIWVHQEAQMKQETGPAYRPGLTSSNTRVPFLESQCKSLLFNGLIALIIAYAVSTYPGSTTLGFSSLCPLQCIPFLYSCCSYWFCSLWAWLRDVTPSVLHHIDISSTKQLSPLLVNPAASLKVSKRSQNTARLLPECRPTVF